MTRQSHLVRRLLPGLALASGLWTAAPGLAADESAYDRCSTIASPTERLACFDEVQKARGHAPAPAAVQAEKRRSFGEKPPAVRAAKPAAAPVAAANNDEDTVVVRLAEVGHSHDGKLWFRTEEGAVWVENDIVIVRLPPKAGDSVRIRRAAVGSYLCDVTRWQAVRCERGAIPR